MNKISIFFSSSFHWFALIFLLLFAGFFLILSCNQKTNSRQHALFDFESFPENQYIICSDLQVKMNKADRQLEIRWGDSSILHSLSFIRGSNSWPVSKYSFYAIDITNTGERDLLVELRPEGNPWLGAGQIIPAGSTKTLLCPIIRDVYPAYIDSFLFGMNAFPEGIIKMWSGLNPDSIQKIILAIIEPSSTGKMIISAPRLENPYNYPDSKVFQNEYFPLLDEFGQLRRKEWPGKSHSLDELLQAGERELSELKNAKEDFGFNRYGGWKVGPHLKSTGHFRVEKLRGRWWLVDPEGCLFWSHGMGTVRFDEATPITDRNHYFSHLPDSMIYKDFYEFQTYSPKGYYKGRNMQAFRQYAWNLMKKYGKDWEDSARNIAHIRLRYWGMNTIGGWSDPNVFMMKKTPYTETLSSNSRRIEGSEGQWHKFPDPYDPSLAQGLTNDIKRIIATTKDPYCIGYFVDNELFWGSHDYIAKAVMMSSAAQPAKQKMREYLQVKFGTIENLNAKWETKFSDWDAFLHFQSIPEKGTAELIEFSSQVAQTYFHTIKNTLAKIAPQKLYLGCRFDFHYYPLEDTSGNWVVKIAQEYCDVLSFNRYRYSATDLKSIGKDVPIIIGEWHMGALDRGMLHFSLRYADSQQNRADMYIYYIKTCLKNTSIVGAHWFEYGDEPVLGRFDGENYNTGFLDICDRPYPEMVNASRSIGHMMYPFRFE